MRVLAAILLAVVSAQRQWRIEHNRLATILLGVSFVDQDFGYVTGGQDGVGPVILQTRNGGASYSRVPFQSQPPPSLALFLSTHAASRTSAASAGLCGFCFEASGIQYTTNGDNFQLANDPSPIFPPAVAIQGGSMLMNGRDPMYGFIGSFGEPYAISFSTDAGSTWQRRAIPYTNAWSRYFTFATPNVWYVTAGQWPRNADEKQTLFEHLDIQTAVVNETFPRVFAKFDFEETKPTARKLLQQRVYRTAILKTTDAGVSWTVMFEDLNSNFYLNNIACLNADTCFAVGDGSRGIGLRTTNGGATWTEFLNEPGQGVQIMDIKFVSQREGFIAGGMLFPEFTGYMYHTLDSGNTWTRQVLPNVCPVSLSLYPDNMGITGGHGTALTRDGQSSTIVYN
jgi:hypothetical protein